LPGDDFNRPSFWYGDIYAGDYLLGRVNFGGTPGGWCDRSADGSRLAFSFLVLSNTTAGHEYLRWLNLRDLAQVYDPTPELELVSKVAWSPRGNLVAFNACQAGQAACGLYVLDTDSNQVRRLPSVGGGYVTPVWKPDASQIAFLGPDANDCLTLYVIDVDSGETVYTGPFDINAWQAEENAPINGWGVEIPRQYAGSNCFINP
jgi:dipeptidyl aminopeptidase/acylaminoacyl peptidase